MKKEKILKRKLIWKGTLAEAEKHPLFQLGQKELAKEILDEIEAAQENYANLEWISKKQAIDIIKQKAGFEK